MSITELRKAGAVSLACCLLLTACGGYHAGEVKNGVYRNRDAGFQIETPDVFTYAERAEYEKWTLCGEAQRQADGRGVADDVEWEYAAKSAECELLILSEPNPAGDSMEAFLARVCNRLSDEESGMKVRDIEKVSVNGVSFERALLASKETEISFFVAQAEQSFVYMLLLSPLHSETAEQQKKALYENFRRL